ncbi:DUF559 domain-containing protein [Pseudarthrobacter sp. AG30]|nr:DUF559 domain-containing protein [Pseudarthrobacter sp. AG30]
MDVCHFLRHAGSVARTATILKAGFSDRDIRNAAASGELCRLRHGMLALREAPQDFVAAVRQGVTTLPYLHQRLPGNRNGAARQVLDLVDGSADSPLEVVARILFRAAGIHTQTQVGLPGIGYVDFLLEGFLIVEIDGASHLEPRQVKKDRSRNNASTLSGYAVLRYGYADVVHNPQKVLAEVWQVLGGRVIR